MNIKFKEDERFVTKETVEIKSVELVEAKPVEEKKEYIPKYQYYSDLINQWITIPSKHMMESWGRMGYKTRITFED